MNKSIIAMQQDYRQFLNSFSKYLSADFNYNDVSIIVDEIEKFWLCRFNLIDQQLHFFSKDKDCMILSSETYLNYNDNEHFIYSSIGDKHVLDDSFIKLSGMVRLNDIELFERYSKKLFRKTLNDQLSIVNNLNSYIYYFPVFLLSERIIPDKNELIHKAFYKILSSLFNCDIVTHEIFLEKYHNYDDIEKALGGNENYIIFSNYSDTGLSIRERVEKYANNQMPSSRIQEMRDGEKFLFSLFSYIGQVFDILTTCVYYNLIPFIRFEITFHYFMLIMNNFTDDKVLTEKITKTIIAYVFYQHIDRNVFKGKNFTNYYTKVKEINYLERICKHIKDKNVDISKGSVNSIVNIVDDVLKEYKIKDLL